jgi:hypothetical protein
MKLRTKAILKAAQKRPRYLVIPLVPLTLLIGNLIMSLAALRQTRRLSRRLTLTPG